MSLSRRQFAKFAAGGSAALAVGWQQACAEVAETGSVTADTVLTLLDAQGARGIYESPEELERLCVAVTNLIQVQGQLRAFPIDNDEQPLTVFRRG